jgi:hypothetical protein
MNDDFDIDIKEFTILLTTNSISLTIKKERYKELLKKYHPDRNEGDKYTLYVEKIIATYKDFQKYPNKNSITYTFDKNYLEKGIFFFEKAKELINKGTAYGNNQLHKSNNKEILTLYKKSLFYFDKLINDGNDVVYRETAKEYKERIITIIKRISLLSKIN